jgi:hypothetical protein
VLLCGHERDADGELRCVTYKSHAALPRLHMPAHSPEGAVVLGLTSLYAITMLLVWVLWM